MLATSATMAMSAPPNCNARLGLLVPLDILPSIVAVRATFRSRPRSLSQAGGYLVNPNAQPAHLLYNRANRSSLLSAGASQV